jgi:hypothetical protein
MGSAYSTHESDQKYVQNLGRNAYREENSEDLEVDGIILEYILGK